MGVTLSGESKCAFCGRSQACALQLLVGTRGAICAFCLSLFNFARLKKEQLVETRIDSLLRLGSAPASEEIHPSLTLEALYNVLGYYLAHKDAVDEYVARVDELARKHYDNYLQRPEPPVVTRLKALRATKKSA